MRDGGCLVGDHLVRICIPLPCIGVRLECGDDGGIDDVGVDDSAGVVYPGWSPDLDAS